jgi:S-adenosylmethionine hydrolase
MSIITLTSDYGLKDHFVGALKGKIISEFAEAKIMDISHTIDPFNSIEASYIITSAYNSFPKGTVHLIGVDAEKNKENQHIAMQWNDHYFVCADNGILGLMLQKSVPQKLVAINIHDRLPDNANDLDVFVKVACHLAKGGSLNVIGREITSIRQITEMQPTVNDAMNVIKGSIIYIDHFGNLVTNITKKMFLELAKGRNYEIILNERLRQQNKSNIKTIWPKYSDIAVSDKYPIKYYEGDKLAIFNEAGFLEIAIFRSNPTSVGSAASLLGIGYRDSISIVFSEIK